MSRRAMRVVLVVGAVLLLASCAAGANDLLRTPPEGGEVAGFWLGLWHGFISGITFVISLFNDDVNIYEVHNNGGWYNFGFMIGVSSFFGGSVHGGNETRRRAPKRI